MKLFQITFDGEDESGKISKSITIVAEDSEHAMKLANELNRTRMIYSAIETEM